MPFPQPVKAVIFDMDGLLVDTERVYLDALLNACASVGQEMTEAFAHSMVGVPGLQRFAFGSIDFEAETGIADEGEAMTAVRTQIVLASCAAGLQAPIDGVSVVFDDEAVVRGQASRSRRLGFGAKLCIHPRQVAPVNAAWRPAPDEVQWATRVLAAFEAGSGGAVALDGKMVDKPVVDRARRILADAAADPSAR